MKKPNVLNRAMFNQGGTSAYGRGITSNLVSNEQRQRYNYGGRVKLAQGNPWEGWGWNQDPSLNFQYPGKTTPKSPYAKSRDWWDTQAAKWNLREMKDYAAPTVEETEDVESQDIYQGSDPRYFTRKFKEEEWGEKTDPDIAPDIPLVEEIKDEATVWEPGVAHSGMPGTPVQDNTDVLEVDRWAFLDEGQKEKQKLARGYGLMEGAAGAARWATAGTAKEKSKAIADTLSKVGQIGAKYKGEATDLKTKAQILGTVEDIKGEQKRKLFEDRLKGYYEPSLEIQREGLELKEEAARLKEEGASNKQIYLSLSSAGKLNNPAAKADFLSSLIGKQIQIASDKKEVDQLSTPENDGVIFMDLKGRLNRNTKGNVTIVDIWQDTEFFGE